MTGALHHICVPVGIKDGSRMPTEEGHQLGGTAGLIDRDDREGASTACFPVDRDVFRIGLRRYERSYCVVACEAVLTLIRLVSQAFFEIRRLS